MRVLILHLADPKMTEWAKSLQGALQNEKCQVDLVDTKYSSSTPVSTAQYQFVVVLTTFKGFWKPIIPIEIDNLLKRSSRLQGRRGAAIVANRFNAGKAVRFLMHLMEVQGMLVEDFAIARSANDFSNLAKRIARLGK